MEEATITNLKAVVADVYADATPPLPPVPGTGGGGGSDNNKPKNRRRLLIAIASIALVLFLVLGGVFAAFMWQPSGSNTTSSSGNSATGIGRTGDGDYHRRKSSACRPEPDGAGSGV